jgi:uncharacterized protein (TIGR02300 family)
VAKPEWGTKRICPSCGARYYDLRKDPPACPSCGTVFDPEALLKSRRARPLPADEPKKKAAPVVADDEVVPDEVEVADEVEEADPAVEGDEAVEEIETEEEDDVLLEDAEELADEDDVGEVVEIEGEEER